MREKELKLISTCPHHIPPHGEFLQFKKTYISPCANFLHLARETCNVRVGGGNVTTDDAAAQCTVITEFKQTTNERSL